MSPRPRTWTTAVSTIRGKPQTQLAFQAPSSCGSMGGEDFTRRPCRWAPSWQERAGAEDHEPLSGRRDRHRHLPRPLGDRHGPSPAVLTALEEQGAIQVIDPAEGRFPAGLARVHLAAL